MPSGPSRHCPDCAVPLERIKLLDKNYRSVEDGLLYTTLSAKRRLWDGNYPEVFEIKGFICPQCGRLQLYGVGSQARLPIPSERAEPDASQLPRPGSADG